MNDCDERPLDGSTSQETSSSTAGLIDYDWAVEQFYTPLYKFAFGLTGSESDAADLTQHTYQALLAKAGQIRDGQKVKGWLFTTLYRKFLGQRRHAACFPEVQVETVEWELPTIESRLDARADANEAIAALQLLDERYRAPLVLFYLQELSYREIAEALHLPIGTIMSRLSRGKEVLRKRLTEPECGGFVHANERLSETDSPDPRLNVVNAVFRVVHNTFGETAACH